MTVNKKILFVEDEKSVVDIARRILSGIDSRLELVVAEDSERAMEILNDGDIGLAFIDGNLKDGAYGPDVARLARGLKVPFIATTADEDLVKDFERYEPYAFLRKPFNLDELEATVRAVYSK